MSLDTLENVSGGKFFYVIIKVVHFFRSDNKGVGCVWIRIGRRVRWHC